MARAEAAGYVNDRAIAEAVVRRRLAGGRGISLIRRELSARGVDRDTLDSVLGGVDADVEADAALAEARRLRARLADQPARKQREKVMASLARRGHSTSAARSAWAALEEVPE